MRSSRRANSNQRQSPQRHTSTRERTPADTQTHTRVVAILCHVSFSIVFTLMPRTLGPFFLKRRGATKLAPLHNTDSELGRPRKGVTGKDREEALSERRKKLALLFTPTVGGQSDEDRKGKRTKREKRKEGEDGGGGRVKDGSRSPQRGNGLVLCEHGAGPASTGNSNTVQKWSTMTASSFAVMVVRWTSASAC